jgi:hypothetical protein
MSELFAGRVGAEANAPASRARAGFNYGRIASISGPAGSPDQGRSNRPRGNPIPTIFTSEDLRERLPFLEDLGSRSTG